MKIGKVSETVLKRSVLQPLKQKGVYGNEFGKSAGEGKDWALSLQSFCLDIPYGVVHAIVPALNQVAAGGRKPAGILLSILLPPDSEEENLKEMMTLAGEICREHSVSVLGGHAEVTEGVNRPIITAVGVGSGRVGTPLPENSDGLVRVERDRKGVSPLRGVKPGQDIVVSKWIGLEGTALLTNVWEKELLARYPAELVEKAKGYDRYLSVIPEAAAAEPYVCMMQDVRNGGIFGALWELGERMGMGLRVELKKIPVRQETIEICEFVDCNPYELLSGGMLLMIADDGEEVVSILEKADIHASVIGKVTGGHDRVILNGEERRFLTPFREDAIYKGKR